MGARLRCASLTIRTICASSVSAPTRSARITSAARAVDRRRRSRGRPRLSRPGIGSPVIIDSSTALRPSRTIAVDRHLLARAHAQAVADLDLVERHVLLRRRRRGLGAPASGASPSSARIAAPVRLRARSSSTWPSRTSVTITAGGLEVDAAPARRRPGTTPGKMPGRAPRTTL